MENKIHIMETVQDIFEPLTYENYENFLEDFKLLIEQTLRMRIDTSQNVSLTYFEWVDDDKRELRNISLNDKPYIQK